MPPTKIAIDGVIEPSDGLIVKLKTMELKAPMTMIPSSPTFTIPLRSEKFRLVTLELAVLNKPV